MCLGHQTLYKLCLVFYYFYILDFIFAFALTVPYLAYSEKPVGGKQVNHYNLSWFVWKSEWPWILYIFINKDISFNLHRGNE